MSDFNIYLYTMDSVIGTYRSVAKNVIIIRLSDLYRYLYRVYIYV